MGAALPNRVALLVLSEDPHVILRSSDVALAAKNLSVKILRDDSIGPLRMTSVVPTALVRFFGRSFKGTPSE